MGMLGLEHPGTYQGEYDVEIIRKAIVPFEPRKSRHC